jgi:hypothetical protein
MKLGVLSNTRLNPWVNWTTLGPPVLGPLSHMPGAKLIEPPPLGFRRLGGLASALAAAYSCDTLFWMQGASRPEPPLHLVASLRGIVKRAAFTVDPFPRSIDNIGRLAVLQGLDPCFIPYTQSLALLLRRFPKGRFEWMPFGVDADVFAPAPEGRPIFAYWMGRRYEPLHQKLLEYCDNRGLEYRFTKVGGEIKSAADLGRIVGSSRYFVVTPPDLDQDVRTGGVSPLVMRYCEGLAAGARLLGVLPRSGEYERMLPLDAILTVAPDGSDLALKLDNDREAEWSAAVESARDLVRSKHSWTARAAQIYRRLEAGEAIKEEEYCL